MLKKILVFFLLLQFIEASPALKDTQKEKEKYAEIDQFVLTFNRLVKINRTQSQNHTAVLQDQSLQNLSKENQRWLSQQLSKAPAQDIFLSRLGEIVTVSYKSTGFVLARINVAKFSETGSVNWDGQEIAIRNIFEQESFREQNKLLKSTLKVANNNRKSLKEKIIENAFFVLTLPLQLLSACTGMEEGSAGALALASGHSMSPVYENYGPRDPYAISRPPTFSGRADAGAHAAEAFTPACIGYKCSDGNTYDTRGHIKK